MFAEALRVGESMGTTMVTGGESRSWTIRCSIFFCWISLSLTSFSRSATVTMRMMSPSQTR